MRTGIDVYIKQLSSKDDGERYNALQEVLLITEKRVDWFEEYKSIFVAMLSYNNSYHRSIGIMILCNLAKNDTKQIEYQKILPLMMNLINDEKFITQRQYIQSIWKVALVGEKYKKEIEKQLENEFNKCISKKHYNLIRLDIINSLGKIYHETKENDLKEIIKNLIESEDDIKYKKKYKEAIKEFLEF